MVAMCDLSCSVACGIIVPQPGIELASSALQGGFFFFLMLLNCGVFCLFVSLIFISWRLITSQHCSGFCHTLT